MNVRFLAAILVALAPLAAGGQVYKQLTLGTNSVPPSATNTSSSSAVLDVAMQDEVTFFLTAVSASATNETTFTLTFVVSPDRTNWFELADYRLDLPLTRTNAVRGHTNLSTRHWRYVKVGQYENTAEDETNNANTATNLALFYLLKR